MERANDTRRKERVMRQLCYVYHIRISQDRVHIEKRGPRKNLLGQPSGRFHYQGRERARIQELQRAARDNTLAPSAMREIGELLSQALLDDLLRRDFFILYEQVRREDALLRIEIDIDERALPEVAALPWEWMYIPAGDHNPAIWLGTAPYLTLVRRRAHWQTPFPPSPGDEHLRIGLAIADSRGVKYQPIVDTLQKLESTHPARFEIPQPHEATINGIDQLLASKPHLFHFIGHGRLKDEAQQEVGQIGLKDELSQDEPLWIDAEGFSELFHRHRPGVVVLQACEGGALSASQAFVGVASQVVQQAIPVVVAMQYEVTNATAQRFALEFYARLAKGEPVDKAVQEGRRHLALSLGYTSRDFATPVIFLGIEDGHLFVLEEATETASAQKEHQKGSIQISAKDGGIAAHTVHGGIHQHNYGQRDPSSSGTNKRINRDS